MNVALNMPVTAEDRSAASIILTQLAALGVDYFFANGGTDFPPIVEAYDRAEAEGTRVPRPLVVTHENLAVSMAHGVYMITGRPQAVMVHVNVGSANTINAIFNASRDQTPVLLFAGRTPYAEHGRLGARSRYIHWAQEMFDQAGMLREAVKGTYELHVAAQAADLVARAWQVATSAPRGPVYVTLPRDTLAEAVPAAAAPILAAPAAPYPDPASVATLARWIAAAERPLIVTSAAGRTRAGFDALAHLTERFALPTTVFHPRFLNMSAAHPAFAGSDPAPLLRDADLVIALDCDVPWVPDVQAPPADCRVAHLGIDPTYADYPMRSFRSDLCIAGDTAPLLDALALALEGESSAKVEMRRSALAARPKTAPKAPAATGAISPEWISACLHAAIDEDTIVINEYPLRSDHCPRTKPGTYFGLSPAGGLGWGFGAALGAKLAAPEKLVVATLGDGAYVFNNPVAGHWTSAAHDLPILTIVFNNALYGAVRSATLGMYADGHAAKKKGRMLADLSPAPAYHQIAEASGGLGLKAERAEDLPALMREAVAAVRGGRQCLLNVVCDY